ncbi:MAG: hypothetical protein J6B01_00195 [Ruminococcus sp.]|nr:hypothetical protein [Ruminococcus sp.]
MLSSENDFVELNVWYAIDKYGRIIEFLTAGFGNIPEFVYTYENNNKMLENYFETKSINHYLTATGKDYFCFDACKGEDNTTNYIKISSPKNPLLLSDLPENIALIISNNILDIDIESIDSFLVDNKYGTKIPLDYIVSLIINGKLNLNMKNEYFSINLKTKLKIKKLMNLLKKEMHVSFSKVKSKFETVDQTEISKQYYVISTSQEKFILYIVYKCDTIVFDKSGLYSLQISRETEAIFDFNDKSGAWINV